MTPKIYHLAGPGFSGRAVKMRDLTPTEKDEAYQSASMEAGEDRSRFLILRTREAVCRMLVAVTDSGLPDFAAVQKAKWHALSLADLQSDKARPLHFDKLFTCKDADVLCGVFLRQHEASSAEVDAIMGKAIQSAD